MYTTNPNPEQYATCQRRGHEAGSVTLTSNPPWHVCRWCRVAYRIENRVLELGGPFGEEDDADA